MPGKYNHYGYWLSSDGELVPVPFEGHSIVAQQIIEEETGKRSSHPYDDLFNNGWVHITTKFGTLVIVTKNKFNDIQIRVLKDIKYKYSPYYIEIFIDKKSYRLNNQKIKLFFDRILNGEDVDISKSIRDNIDNNPNFFNSQDNSYGSSSRRIKANNWYHRLIESSMEKVASEWWIDDDGFAMYADGDIGDMNHEAHVIQTVLSKYDLDPEQVDIYNSNDFIDDFARENLDECIEKVKEDGNWNEEMERLFEENPNSPQLAILIGRQLTLEDILLLSGATPEEASIGAGRGDAREFAIKNWNWKVLRGDNIETWNLTTKDIAAIYRGVSDSIEQGGNYEDEEKDSTVNIYVLSNGSWFNDVPMSILALDNPVKLLPYKGGGSSGIIQDTTVIDRDIFNPYKKYEGD